MIPQHCLCIALLAYVFGLNATHIILHRAFSDTLYLLI